MVRVLIVDDSALVREALTDILGSDADLEVVGTAAEPRAARKKIQDLQPDVITLDIMMPGMDGLTFLEQLMRLRPMPVVMISALTEEASEMTLRALELGAVDIVAKPKMGIREGLWENAADIVSRVKTAGRVPRSRLRALMDRP